MNERMYIMVAGLEEGRCAREQTLEPGKEDTARI